MRQGLQVLRELSQVQRETLETPAQKQDRRVRAQRVSRAQRAVHRCPLQPILLEWANRVRRVSGQQAYQDPREAHRLAQQVRLLTTEERLELLG